MARTKGAKGKHTFMVEQIAHRFKMEPIEILLHIAHGDWEALGYESEGRTVHGKDFLNEIPHITLQDRLAAAQGACKYLYSTRQPVNDKGDTAIEVSFCDYKPPKNEIQDRPSTQTALIPRST